MSEASSGRLFLHGVPADIADLYIALREGDPEKVMALIEAGADIHYQRQHGYNALLDAVQSRCTGLDSRLLELLALLAAQGVNLSAISDWAESGLRVLSLIGRFDAVELLLNAGADRTQLQWTPLMEAVALGSLEEVEACLEQGADLEARDWWSRTPWLIALVTGDIAKTHLLADWGANTQACGRCQYPPLFYAIQSHSVAMVQWVLEQGASVHQTNEFGSTALIEAIKQDDVECVCLLLEAGADLEADYCGPALHHAQSLEILRLLLAQGANPAHLQYKGQRTLLGLPPVNERPLKQVSADDFQHTSTRRFGKNHPEQMQLPFWEAMIRSGVSAYRARRHFDSLYNQLREPIWCADRFGQSLTILPDGRAIQIGGEHEDHYDPDFCIYNDVFVHDASGEIRIYGYPEAVFPPTDFHTATLIDEFIYVIGCLGYYGTRRYGETPVYRLNVHTLQIEKLAPEGEPPGWLYEHRAIAFESFAIRVWEGTLLWEKDGKEFSEPNLQTYVLDLKQLQWFRQ